MTTTRRIALAALAVAVVGGGACRRKPQAVPGPVTVAAPDADSLARARAREDSLRRAQALADSLARAREDSVRRAAETGVLSPEESMRLREALLAMVYFDYDRAELRDDARAALEAKVPILMANQDVVIRVAGHTDNRGSDEYNVALGHRRASMVKQFLMDRGVGDNRIQTVTFGEERPLCQEETETCYTLNRRAEFVLVSGGANLRRQ